jgi:23S rRNA G2445 N2-methylase RlmL
VLTFKLRWWCRFQVTDRLEVKLLDIKSPSAEALKGYDIIVSNPPYVPSHRVDMLEPEVRNYESRFVGSVCPQLPWKQLWCWFAD